MCFITTNYTPRHPADTYRHPPDTNRHQQTPPRHPSDIIQTPFRHSPNAFYAHFGFYHSISPNPLYNTSDTPETPIDTHRHPRHPLYTLQTTSRHPPDALCSHSWCLTRLYNVTWVFISEVIWEFYLPLTPLSMKAS